MVGNLCVRSHAPPIANGCLDLVPGILNSGLCCISSDSSVHSAFNEPKIVGNTQRSQKLCLFEDPEFVSSMPRAEIFTENASCWEIW